MSDSSRDAWLEAFPHLAEYADIAHLSVVGGELVEVDRTTVAVPPRLGDVIEDLAGNTLIDMDHANRVATLQRAFAGSVAQARQLVEQALLLCQNGERAPGGDETWAEWAGRAEVWLRGQEGPVVNACAVDESGGVDPDREAAERAAAKRIGMALTNASAVAGERGVIADWLRRRAFDGVLGAETVAVLDAAADRIERGAV